MTGLQLSPHPASPAGPAGLPESVTPGMDGIVTADIAIIGAGMAGASLAYGLRGSGADLIAEGLAGLHPDIRGTLRLNGQPCPIFPTPLAARRANIAYVPSERKRDGLVLLLPIQSNIVLLILRQLSQWGIMRRRREQTTANDLVRRFDVRYRRLGQKIGQLSGGNQQKVLLASRMAVDPELLILQEPTRGVDVGARVEIHRFLMEIAQRGCAVLLVSSDVEEAVILSHRLIVMREGSIMGELSGASKTQASAIALAAASDHQRLAGGAIQLADGENHPLASHH